MYKFKIFNDCKYCGMEFESDYKLVKHVSLSHPETLSFGEREIGDKDHTDRCNCGQP